MLYNDGNTDGPCCEFTLNKTVPLTRPYSAIIHYGTTYLYKYPPSQLSSSQQYYKHTITKSALYIRAINNRNDYL